MPAINRQQEVRWIHRVRGHGPLLPHHFP